MSLKEANAFVTEHYRHHKSVTDHKFSLGCIQDGELVGVAIVGHPVSRYLDDGITLEVNRAFTFHGTMEEMIETCIPNMAAANPGMSGEEARRIMLE